MEQNRQQQLNEWLSQVLEGQSFSLEPASMDASFRQYFRVSYGNTQRIVMDAPPSHEDLEPFIRVDHLLQGMGLNVPDIFAENHQQGFLLLEDFGQVSYLQNLSDDSVDSLYGQALDALLTLQSVSLDDGVLPVYDHAKLMSEMELFPEWFLRRYLGLSLSAEQQHLLHTLFEQLSQRALAQYAVCVHRDYHARNLMVTTTRNPGIIDFQDAVIGPVTYDLVSLLKDCYIRWPKPQVEAWVMAYFARLEQQVPAFSGGVWKRREDDFLKDFHWMGVQRHLKAVGIFARLCQRDHKPGYLLDIPRTLTYIQTVCEAEVALQPLAVYLQHVVWPAWHQRESA